MPYDYLFGQGSGLVALTFFFLEAGISNLIRLEINVDFQRFFCSYLSTMWKDK